MRGIFIVLLLHFSSTITAQRQFYISSSGNDSSEGTMLHPFRTIGKLNGLQFQPGDRILFKGGATYKGELILNENDSSDPHNPITIGSYGQSNASILAGKGNAILISNLNGIVIKNLNVSSDDPLNNGYGVKVSNALPGNKMLENVRIHHVTASNFKWAGIFVGGIPTDLPKVQAIAGARYGFKDILIDSCEAHNNMYYGIYISGSWTPDTRDYANERVVLRDCITYDNTGDSTYTTNHSGSGIL
ncbi:MAG: hypothetical protein H0X41_05485, partial [Chitinophagaceae bacterium]|nr:hypothetical protein [Chitinophagaceae bacterium]